MTTDRTKDIEVIRVTAEIQPSVNVDSELLLALIRERDEARERIAEQEREYQRERIVQVREINARLAAEAALSAAQEEVGRYKAGITQIAAHLANAGRGEETTNERILDRVDEVLSTLTKEPHHG